MLGPLPEGESPFRTRWLRRTGVRLLVVVGSRRSGGREFRRAVLGALLVLLAHVACPFVTRSPEVVVEVASDPAEVGPLRVTEVDLGEGETVRRGGDRAFPRRGAAPALVLSYFGYV